MGSALTFLPAIVNKTMVFVICRKKLTAHGKRCAAKRAARKRVRTVVRRRLLRPWNLTSLHLVPKSQRVLIFLHAIAPKIMAFVIYKRKLTALERKCAPKPTARQPAPTVVRQRRQRRRSLRQWKLTSHRLAQETEYVLIFLSAIANRTMVFATSKKRLTLQGQKCVAKSVARMPAKSVPCNGLTIGSYMKIRKIIGSGGFDVYGSV